MAPLQVDQVRSTLLSARNNVLKDSQDAANALDMQMGLDLMHASIQASEDPAVRVVLITGAGKMFSGGGDLKSFAAQGEALPA